MSIKQAYNRIKCVGIYNTYTSTYNRWTCLDKGYCFNLDTVKIFRPVELLVKEFVSKVLSLHLLMPPCEHYCIPGLKYRAQFPPKKQRKAAASILNLRSPIAIRSNSGEATRGRAMRGLICLKIRFKRLAASGRRASLLLQWELTLRVLMELLAHGPLQIFAM